jgi:phosphatidylglycerophosphate synthase
MNERLHSFPEKAKERIDHLREDVSERLGQNEGHIALAFGPTRAVAEFLAEKKHITPNLITITGGIAGALGASVAAEPGEYARGIERITGKEVSENKLKLAGFICAVVLGYGADALDGSVAELKERMGEKGYTKLGRLLDGFFDKLIENAGVLSIMFAPSESKTEKPGWSLYPYFSQLATLIRSSALANGLDMDEKSGSGSRGDIELVFGVGHAVSSPLTWRGKGSHGLILTLIRGKSAMDRWKTVEGFDDTEVENNVLKDVVDLTLLHAAGYTIGKKAGIGGSTGEYFLGIFKLVDTMAREPDVYGRGLGQLATEKAQRVVDKFNSGEVFNRQNQEPG